jgi:acetylornithine deacetylase
MPPPRRPGLTDLVELAARLVRIESINPELGTGGSGEGAVARAIAEWAERAGLEARLTEPAPGRFNVLVCARGSGGGRTLLLNGHTDTVGVSGMSDPFSGRVEGDRLFGRGSYDMKGAVAACLVACERAARLRLRGDVVVTAVADEEVASVGTEAVAATVDAAAAIVAEPTEEQLGVAHRGFATFQVRVAGRAAHGSRPDLGIDAIANTGPVLTRLTELNSRLAAGPGHPLLGTGSVHASVISGGQEYSSYPAACELHAERRTIPGETREDVAREVAEVVGDADATWQVTLARGPYAVDDGAEIAAVVSRHADDPPRIGLPFWTDAALLQAAGIPTVLYGPSGEGAHADVEWVSIESLERCAGTFLRVAQEVCA